MIILTLYGGVMVGAEPGSRPLMKRIFCPVDFSESSKRALINALRLSRTFKGHLTVLTVYEPLLSGFFGPDRTQGYAFHPCVGGDGRCLSADG